MAEATIAQTDGAPDPFDELFQKNLEGEWAKHWDRYNRAVMNNNVSLAGAIHDEVKNEAARKAQIVMRRLEAKPEIRAEDFMGMVATNPRGWGNQPPPSQFQGEARSANTPMGDAVAQATGSPLAGRVATGAENISRGVVDTAYGLTGIPMAAEGGKHMAQAVESGSPTRGAGAAMEVGLATMPFMGKAARAAFQTLPRGIATGTAYGAAPGLAAGTLIPDSAEAQSRKKGSQAKAETQPEGPPPDDGLMPDQRARRNLLNQKLSRENWLPKVEREELQGLNKISADYATGKNAAAAETERLRGAAQAEGEKIAATAKAQREADAAKAQADEAQRKKSANESIRDKYPEVMPFVAPLTAVLAGGIGAKIKGSAVTAFNEKLQGLSARWSDAVERANRARPGSPAHARAVEEAKGIGAQFEALEKKGSGGTGKAIAAGASVGEVGTFLPDEIDLMRAAPGSELQQNVLRPYQEDPSLFFKRMGVGMVTGGGPALAGAEFAGRRVSTAPNYRGETDALSRGPPAGPGGRPSPSGSGQPQGPTGGQPPSSPNLLASAQASQSSSQAPSGSPLLITRSKAGFHGPDGKLLPHSSIPENYLEMVKRRKKKED